MNNAQKTTTFAVIETGGKQYRVAAGDSIRVEKLPDGRTGGEVFFDRVLLVERDSETKIGMPYVPGARVSGTIGEIGRGKKVNVVQYKQKSRYFKLRGHRQPFCEVRVTAVESA